jgi:hypothetical protein
MVFVGGEIATDTTHGAGLVNTPAGNPARAVYLYGVGAGAQGNRPTWEINGLLYAIYGLSVGGDTLYSYSANGRITVDGSGNNTFSTASGGPQRYLIRVASAATLSALAEDAISYAPAWAVSTKDDINLGPNRLGFTVGFPGETFPDNYYIGWGTGIFNGSRVTKSSGTAYTLGYENTGDRLALYTIDGATTTLRWAIDATGAFTGDTLKVRGLNHNQLALLGQASGRYTTLWFRQSDDDTTNRSGIYFDKDDQSFNINSIGSRPIYFLTEGSLKGGLTSSGRPFFNAVPSYADDAAADADSALPSGGFYKITGSRVVYQKP